MSPDEGIQLVGTYEHLIQKRQALVAQVIVDNAPGVLFNTKRANFTLSNKTIAKM